MSESALKLRLEELEKQNEALLEAASKLTSMNMDIIGFSMALKNDKFDEAQEFLDDLRDQSRDVFSMLKNAVSSGAEDAE